MIDIKTCNEKIAILGLRFPTTEKEEKSAFVKLIREHNPDLCETAECAAIHEPKIAEIMEAHQFWKANYEICNKITNDHISTMTEKHFGFFGNDPHTKKVIAGAISKLEAMGYHF